MSTKSYVMQGIAAPVIASKLTGRSQSEYEYSSIKAFAEIELGGDGKRGKVTRRLKAGGGIVEGWAVRLA